MKISMVLGVVAIILSPLVAIGMAIDNADYWFALDITMIVVMPIVGILLLLESKRRNAA